MADKEKNLPENEKLNNQISSEQENTSREDQLKEAAENIAKASAAFPHSLLSRVRGCSPHSFPGILRSSALPCTK